MDTREESLPELVTRVVDDAKEVARAELDLVKAQAVARVVGYRAPAILFAFAGLLAMAALPALLVGLILTLAPRVGLGWATLIVIGLTLLVAGVLGKLGRDRLKGQK